MKIFAHWTRRLFLGLLILCFGILVIRQLMLIRGGVDGVQRIAHHLDAEICSDTEKIAAASQADAALFVYLTFESEATAEVELYVDGTLAGDFGRGVLTLKVMEGNELTLRATRAGVSVTVLDFPSVLDAQSLSATAQTVRGELNLGRVKFL